LPPETEENTQLERIIACNTIHAKFHLEDKCLLLDMVEEFIFTDRLRYERHSDEKQPVFLIRIPCSQSGKH
jgi:hypothetical protein